MNLIWFTLVLGAWAQNGDQREAIQKVFSVPRIDLEEVTKPPAESLGAIEKCGEGADQGMHKCVPYNLCDGETNLIVQTGVTDGFGKIDIRFGHNTCTHFLDVCCGIPEGGVREPDEDIPVPTSKPPTPSPSPPPRPVPTGCGIRNDNGIDFKITGNTDNEAEYGEFPWMVALLRKEFDPDKESFLACGGSLIAPNVVLTGAHCVSKHKTYDLYVRAGEWDTQTEKERLPYQEREISRIIVHEDFNPNNLFNDFALLILDRPFDKAEHIGTICLPEQEEILDSQNCYVSGWGKDVFGKEGKYSVILKKIELPIVEHSKCQESLRTTRLGHHFKLHESFLCAGGEHGKDACTGDGGSPLVCPDRKNPSRYVQAGIVAWGIGCGEIGIPGVYANVAKFRNWIDGNLAKLNINSSYYN